MKIQIDRLKKSYRQGSETIEVLKDVSFHLESGEIVAVLGQSGSGKTTLLGLLAGLDQADSGGIHFHDTDFLNLNENQKTAFRGEKIGIVFQSYHLVPHLTALENVLLPLEILRKNDGEARARTLLQQVGLANRLHHFPSQLSGGEAQRAALARALVIEPQILLADEPSGHLDQTTGRKVMDLFFEVARTSRATTLLVTHDPELAKRCDRQIHLQNGTVLS